MQTLSKRLKPVWRPYDGSCPFIPGAWLHCHASVHKETAFPEPSSHYAKEGTDAHLLAATGGLREDNNAQGYIGATLDNGILPK